MLDNGVGRGLVRADDLGSVHRGLDDRPAIGCTATRSGVPGHSV